MESEADDEMLPPGCTAVRTRGQEGWDGTCPCGATFAKKTKRELCNVMQAHWCEKHPVRPLVEAHRQRLNAERTSARVLPPHMMKDIAVQTAKQSPCAKSQRGVVVWRDDAGQLCVTGRGFNGPPTGFACDGSEAILDAGIERVWLLHDDGWRAYPADEFHELTLRYCGLPVIRETEEGDTCEHCCSYWPADRLEMHCGAMWCPNCIDEARAEEGIDDE